MQLLGNLVGLFWDIPPLLIVIRLWLEEACLCLQLTCCNAGGVCWGICPILSHVPSCHPLIKTPRVTWCCCDCHRHTAQRLRRVDTSVHSSTSRTNTTSRNSRTSCTSSTSRTCSTVATGEGRERAYYMGRPLISSLCETWELPTSEMLFQI